VRCASCLKLSRVDAIKAAHKGRVDAIEMLPSKRPKSFLHEYEPAINAPPWDMLRTASRFALLPFRPKLGLHRDRDLGRGRAGGRRRLLRRLLRLSPLLLLLLRLPGIVRVISVNSRKASLLMVWRYFHAVHDKGHLLAAREARRLAKILPLASAQRAACCRRPLSRR
jgi:hypothetical protein